MYRSLCSRSCTASTRTSSVDRHNAVVVLLPVTAFLAYRSVYVNDRYDVPFLAGFLMFSAGAGVLIGHVRARGHDQWFFPGLGAAYVAAVFAALCIAALDTPTLPLVEVRAGLDIVPNCSDLPKDRTFVKVSEAPNLLYLYNEFGFLALSVFDVQPHRYHKDCPVLRTRGNYSEITPRVARTRRRPAS